MSERLTDEELDALIARFSPGRHPKVAAALAELLEFRSGERQRAMDGLLDAVAGSLANMLAKIAAASARPLEVTAGTRATVPLIRETPLEMPEPIRATTLRGRREVTVEVSGTSPLARRLSAMYVSGESFTLGEDAVALSVEPEERWTVADVMHSAGRGGSIVTTFALLEVAPTPACSEGSLGIADRD